MRAVIQRVSGASVTIDGKVVASIGMGLLLLVGIEEHDDVADAEWLCGKIVKLRIFPDETGVMNQAVTDVNGEMLVVSQFTLFASTRKGNRPSYIRAASPEKAIPLYEKVLLLLEKETGKAVQCGIFGAMMQVSLVNEGPVTILVDSKSKE